MSYIEPQPGDIVIFSALDELEDSLEVGREYEVYEVSLDDLWSFNGSRNAIYDDAGDARRFPTSYDGYEVGYRFELITPQLEND